ncbi:uncharacterized protein LOC144624504 [Crassostrea virginica]
MFNFNKLSEVNKCRSKLNEYQDFPEHGDLELLSLRSNIDQGKELIIEIGGFRATLKQISPPSCSPSADVSRLTTGIGKLMDQVSVIATIPTNYKPLAGVVCEGGAEAWIFGDNTTITRIDMHGTVRDTVSTTCRSCPGGISVTRGKELIYSDRNSRTVNIVRHGKSETMITTPQDWTPFRLERPQDWTPFRLGRPQGWTLRRLSCTRSGDILGQNMKQEIYKDGQGNPIFKDGGYSLYMSENNNGDVCVSDPNADAVVVVDKTGRVRFRYDSKLARRKKSFDPRDIVTDALGQIIVTDINNNCLHILDQNGQFLKCVDDCGLERPLGLSVDSEGRLWVGLYEKGEIKVIKYMEQS